ncbi:MAG: TldD/PmbA family protein [Prolixibacteraceae bacterium]|nr:TldD/PmbA family protein [Prolixibacteraceae bacterium]MBT6764362.1 TldD/PmbA family protein [Prolixibacteraceae bacterium]MBT6998154.1 TldD/PmbA family protein [Prolixibacteraceae bacterium]MBT7395696.1 TldD/PmbA family protein [Prolixibacteraceae bacterium]
MDHALKNGAQQASVSISDSRSSSIEVRDEKIDKLEQAIQSSLSIRLFVDKRYSAHSTNRINKKELARFIEEAIAGTKFLSEDEFRALPEPSLYYKGDGSDLNTLDTNFDKVNPEKKIEIAFAAEKEALGKDERIISVSASYYDGLSSRVMVTSNGFEGDTSNSYYGLNASVSVKGKDARPESYWGESAIFFEKLKKQGAGKKALKRALEKIGQEKIASDKLPMIVENRLVGRIFGPLISALSGSAIQQKNSFLIDKLGEKVVSEKLTLTDDPFIVSGRGSRLFDNEGLATKKRPVFDKGVLKTYYIDTYYGKKLEMDPTSGGTTNLVFEIGDKNLEGLIASVEKGILVTGFNGGNSNGTTGDFSYGIEGFLIEKGKLVQAVSEMNITGNMLDLWSNIGEIGNDANKDSSWLTPSVLFEGVDFSGI